MRTPTAQTILRDLIDYARCRLFGMKLLPGPKPFASVCTFCQLSFKALDQLYRDRAQEHPERAQEWRAVRKHLARLRNVLTWPGRDDFWNNEDHLEDCWHEIRRWSYARRTALSPSPRLPVEEVVQQFEQAREAIAAMRRKIAAMRQQRAALKKKILAQARIAQDLLDELAIRHYPTALSMPPTEVADRDEEKYEPGPEAPDEGPAPEDDL
jgi:hypothetical protein